MKKSLLALCIFLPLLLLLPSATAQKAFRAKKKPPQTTASQAPTGATGEAPTTAGSAQPKPAKARRRSLPKGPSSPGRPTRPPYSSTRTPRTPARVRPEGDERTTATGEQVEPAEFAGDVRDLPQVPVTPMAEVEMEGPPRTRALPDRRALPQTEPNVALGAMPAPLLSFEGLGYNTIVTGGFAGAGRPPDINGEVGLNHYVQAVNSSYAIYSKTGTLLAAFTENALWDGVGTTPCNGFNRGDPVVVYDQFADRWILSNFAFAKDFNDEPVTPFYQCFAVSKTGDPVSGGWWLYALHIDTGAANHPPVGTFNDYAKFGNWNDGCLYMSANGFFQGRGNGMVFASLNKSDMENGAPLTWAMGFISLSGASPVFSAVPSHISGARDPSSLPPVGTPNYFVSESLSVYAFDVRKFTPGVRCGGGGSLSAPTNVGHAQYYPPDDGTQGPSRGWIVPQPLTPTLLDSVDDRMMQKVQYRRVGSAQSLWVNHTVRTANSSGSTGIQWAQINVNGGAVATTPVQQQIYKPDSNTYRWMGSIAADRLGNVALGYSVSSAGIFPSVAYSGRLAADPLNNLSQTEALLVAGGGSQVEVPRWGDYTSMSVDPADDCTFWYTNQYYGSQFNGNNAYWQTRVGAFRFPSCSTTPCTFSISPTSQSFTSAAGSGSVAVTAPAGCGWTAASGSTFVTVTSGASGSGNGTVNYSVAANPGTSSRSGTLTIAGQTFTVNQAANAASSLQLSAASFGVNESARKVLVNVTRTGNTSAAASVNYATADGTASRLRDYTQTLGTLIFAAGETTKTVTVFVTNDAFAEPAETFSFTLSGVAGATLGSPAAGTVTITSDDAANGVNPVGDAAFNADFFVRQHYVDFLNREADASGLGFWTGEITQCGANITCRDVKRINVSAAFFLSIEFQNTGYLVYRFYKAGHGDATSAGVAGTVPAVRLNEFLPDTQRIGQGVVVNQGNWQALLEANKQAYALEFAQRARFLAAFPVTLTPAQFVDKLRANTGAALSQAERDQLVAELSANNTTDGRASVLRKVAEDASLQTAESNRAFVLMQYFGYLRRNPDDTPEPGLNYGGWKFWLDKLNQFGGDYVSAEMVKAFITSAEYRQRFGP